MPSASDKLIEGEPVSASGKLTTEDQKENIAKVFGGASKEELFLVKQLTSMKGSGYGDSDEEKARALKELREAPQYEDMIKDAQTNMKPLGN